MYLQCCPDLLRINRLLGSLSIKIPSTQASCVKPSHQVRYQPICNHRLTVKRVVLLDGPRETLQLKSLLIATRMSIWRLPASTVRWRKRKSALSSLKSTKRAAGTRTCKIYSRSSMKTDKGDSKVSNSERNKRHASRCNTVLSHLKL
jgi:hypothetical protein